VLYLLTEGRIKEKIKARKTRVAVIGLGRVGLPLASTLADRGFRVIGIDIDEKLVSLINKGEVYRKDEVGLQDLVEKNVKEGRLQAASEMASVKDCDVAIITVPTLITKKNEPDIKAVEAVASRIAKFSKGKVIVLESTVPPFTTRNMGKTIEKKTGLKAGEDFGLAYSPERVQAPQVLKDLRTYPKIVSGIDEKSTLIVSEIYSTFAPNIIKMSSPVAAEIEKIVENAQRDMNIAFANELAKICEIYGVDAFEVIKTANSQPFCNILSPGSGVGGHCIPMDPYYVIKDVERRGYEPSLLKTARKINESMPKHIVNMVKNCIDKGKVAILGLSFKPDVKAFEHSPTLMIIKLLKGYNTVVHDPFLEDEKFHFKTERNIRKAIENSDCILLSTAHAAYKELDLKEVKKLMKGNILIDGRGFFDPKDVENAGLMYRGIGRAHD
jgi:nucleotide sugar dehydrogenase